MDDGACSSASTVVATPAEVGPLSTPSTLAVPAGVRARFVSTPTGRLALLDTAPDPAATHGATVVLVPGYTGSKEDFLSVLRPLADGGHRVVAYDQRGQYESDGAAAEPPTTDHNGAGSAYPASSAYSLAGLSDDLLTVVDSLGDDAVHVVGHSFGGLVVRAAALARPAAFRSVTLLDSGPAGIGGSRAERIRLLRPVLDEGGLPAVWTRMAELAAAEPAPTSGGAASGGAAGGTDGGTDGGAATTAEVTAFLRRRFFASSAVGLRAMGDELLSEPDRSVDLAGTGLPVLVAYGENDDAWPPAVQADMADRLGAQHAVIEGAVHSPAVEAPEATVEVLLRFWRSVEAAEGRT